MPTIHRLLRSLINDGYVRQESSKRYALGPRLIRLGESASRTLGSWAMPHLAQVVARCGETANMAMLEGDACVYIAQVPSPNFVRMFTEVGRVVPLHSTGVGKALLSTLPDEKVVMILRRAGMPSITEHTITTPDALLDDLAHVRKNRYAIDDGEQELGVRCIAVPLEASLSRRRFRLRAQQPHPDGRCPGHRIAASRRSCRHQRCLRCHSAVL